MKVLLLTTDAYGANGGIALYNRDVVDALCLMPNVTQVVVVVRNMPLPAEYIPAKALLRSASAGGKIRFIKTACLATLQKYDLVICGHINLLPLAALLNQFMHAPLVQMVYGIEVWQSPNVFSRLLLRSVDSFWSISAITTHRMNQWARLEKNRYVQLPNAIHLEQYGIRPTNTELRYRYGLIGASVILTLARLSAKERYKGIDEVIDSFPSLLLHHPNLKYVVCGDGDDKTRLQKKVHTLGLSDRVIFTGMLKESEKADHLRLADAFVMPGRGEGFGFVFLEALACGLPVVGSQLDGSCEALLGGELGELANPDDPASVQACILNALSKPIGIPPGLNYFDWDNYQNRLSIAVKQILSYKSL